MRSWKSSALEKAVIISGLVALMSGLVFAANISPMTPELAAKQETIRKQREQRITPDKRKAAAEALKTFGTIDILVNNAGVAVVKSIIDTGVEDWEWVNAVNLRAPFLLAQALAPNMIKQGMGKIINISSQSGVVALADHGAYGASKGGLNMLTKVMTIEWAKYNIQANTVCPTVILTPMGEMVWGDPAKGGPMKAKIPAGRFGKTVEVADLILFLASSASDLINGQDILIDGGFTAQ